MAPVIRRKMLSPDRNRVMSLHNDGKSLSDIADIIGRARTNVQRIVAKYKQYGRSLRDRFEPIATIARELKVGSDKTVLRFIVSRMIKRVACIYVPCLQASDF